MQSEVFSEYSADILNPYLPSDSKGPVVLFWEVAACLPSYFSHFLSGQAAVVDAVFTDCI